MCSNNPSFLTSDEFYAGTLHILTSLEIPIHLFGAFVILARTPTKMQSVKTNMLILHFVGALLDNYLSFLTIPVLTLPVVSGYVLGISLIFGISTSIQVYFGVSLIGVLGVAIVLFFEDRYRRLVSVQGSDGIRSWQRNLYAVVLYLISFTFYAPAFFDIPEETIGKTAARQVNPCIPDEILNRPGYIIISIDNTIPFICISSMFSLTVGQAMFFVFSILRFLFRKNSSRSAATIRLQKQLFKAMCLQVAIPLFVICFPVGYIVAAIGSNYYNQAGNNIAVTVLAFHGILSTLTMLIVHTPYRKATSEIFWTCKIPSNQGLWRTAIVSLAQPSNL